MSLSACPQRTKIIYNCALNRVTLRNTLFIKMATRSLTVVFIQSRNSFRSDRSSDSVRWVSVIMKYEYIL